MNMKEAIFFAFALLLPACHDEPTMSFGLLLRSRESSLPPEQGLDSCRPPGEYGGSRFGVSIDNWEINEPPPHLFLETNPDAEENVYRVRVYSALEYEKDGIWWKPSELLAERTYDSAFGEGGRQDSFMVDFGEEQYTVEARGLPPDATCP
jgi:hypothetical protein